MKKYVKLAAISMAVAMIAGATVAQAECFGNACVPSSANSYTIGGADFNASSSGLGTGNTTFSGGNVDGRYALGESQSSIDAKILFSGNSCEGCPENATGISAMLKSYTIGASGIEVRGPGAVSAEARSSANSILKGSGSSWSTIKAPTQP